MDKTILLPDIGDFKDVEVVELLVKPGDAVKAGDSILVLESEKATMDLPCPEGGRVKQFLVKVGDKISKGAPLLVLELGVEAGAKPLAVPSAAPPPAPSKPVQPVSPAPSVPAPAEPPPPLSAAKKAHASPSVRRFARELGIDLSYVPGRGPHGRILKEDVQDYVKRYVAKAGTATGEAFAFPEVPLIDFSQFGEIAIQPLSKIQKVSGRNLHRSWVTAPHVTQHDEADITDLEEFRKEMIAKRSSDGVKITILSFFMKAVVAALKDHPKFNASLDSTGENLVLKRYFHIGVAVDTPNGLVVPVIRDVNHKGLVDLARELAAISEKARARRLTPHDLQGGCFSISSLGGIGGSFFTPIINVPEVAVLGVSKAVTKPVWKDGKFVPRLLVPLSLSYDHRVIDGADGVRFITRIKEVLQDVRTMLL
ncbi:MAG: dihydrolipoyllysine-residue acetyltransferase [Bdellovibrionota bacterium]